MELFKICPKCGKIMSWNNRFHAYICAYCDYVERTDGGRKMSATMQYTLWTVWGIIMILCGWYALYRR